MNIIKAPFSPAQVYLLNEYQNSGRLHPLTCDGDGRTDRAIHADGEGRLVATTRGWICPYCSYKQGWAPAFMITEQANDRGD